jgi:hypothetical protein
MAMRSLLCLIRLSYILKEAVTRGFVLDLCGELDEGAFGRLVRPQDFGLIANLVGDFLKAKPDI